MVVGESIFRVTLGCFALQESAAALIEQLDPPRRAAVLMAILGLVLTGLALIVCIMIGGRWVRRLARYRSSRSTRASHHENQRLRKTLQPILPTGSSLPAETAIAHQSGDDTRPDR